MINSMAVYQMQIHKLPARMHKELDKCARRCVWGSKEEKRALHLISWDALCHPKDREGVGLECSAAMNKSLLTKLAWRLCHEETIWSRIIRAKYVISLDEPPVFKPKARSLVIWRGLYWGSELLHRGLRW